MTETVETEASRPTPLTADQKALASTVQEWAENQTEGDAQTAARILRRAANKLAPPRPAQTYRPKVDPARDEAVTAQLKRLQASTTSALAKITGYHPRSVHSTLVQFEAAGVVQQLPGKIFLWLGDSPVEASAE